MSAPAAPLPPWLRAIDGGVTLALAVQPNAKASSIAGVHGDRLKVKVASPPVDGAANAALCAFLAARLGVKERQVSVARGATGRQKVIEIIGITAEEAAARLAADLAD
jgi:uncharacterized protein (TIGR00251 family)